MSNIIFVLVALQGMRSTNSFAFVKERQQNKEKTHELVSFINRVQYPLKASSLISFSLVPATMNNLPDERGPLLAKNESGTHETRLFKWWFLVSLSIVLTLLSQTSGVLLGRFYYAGGGNSRWIVALIQTAGFPILFVPLFLCRPPPQNPSNPCSVKTVASLYFFLGVIVAGSTFLFSTGMSTLSASTFSLICGTQLAFVAVFSYLINSQKLTPLILNSVVVLSLSAALVMVNDDTKESSGRVSKSKYLIGFILTLTATAMYSLFVSLMQLSFKRVLRRETFSVVIELQVFVQLVATCATLVGLFASGEWRVLHEEMDGFGKGRFAYVMTLVSIALGWQVYAVCSTGLIFFVSSLFSSVITTLAFIVTQLTSVLVFHDKMNGVKMVAFLMAVWGFASYIYQSHLDNPREKRAESDLTPSENGCST